MGFEIAFSRTALKELERLRAFDHRRIVDAVDHNLVDQPLVETRNRKCLGDQLIADFEYVPPLWELKCGDLRVFYSGDETAKVVTVLAVRRKPPNKTTAEVLHEANGH